MRLKILAAILATASPAVAETVLMYEDFDNDYTKSFYYLYDADNLPAHSSIAPIFYSSVAGKYMPWWTARDSETSADRFMASHSYYQTPGTSDDWLISQPLEVPTRGFMLEFDAQCVNVRGADRLSDLSLFITEELVDPDNFPATPTKVWEQVPLGNDPDNCAGDWTHYTYPLDEYAGKTIYLNFVNRNYDKDILCIDNVKVSRFDPATISLEAYSPYTVDEAPVVGVTVDVLSEGGLANWSVVLESAGTTVNRWDGATIAKGTSLFQANLPLELGKATPFTFTFKADGTEMLTAVGEMTRIAFEPVHRVLMEETTSLHCGNCPAGMYTVESMLEDPELSDRVIPVSVHIASMGYDPMATEAYYPHLPVSTSAPLVFVERNTEYDGFIPAYDSNYDPTNPNSFAWRIARRADTPTPVDVKVSAEWVTAGSDTTALNCTATVTPAYDIADKEYRVLFILTENNVGLDENPYWIQSNYLSGVNATSRYGGWSDLGEYVLNARYHHVARNISDYNGHAGSLPASMATGTEYTYSHVMQVPDTHLESNDILVSEAIRTSMCEVTALVIDAGTGLAVNAARVAMSEDATHLYTTADLVAAGIAGVTVDSDAAPTAYYDMAGRRVTPSAPGIYVRVSADGTARKTTKIGNR